MRKQLKAARDDRAMVCLGRVDDWDDVHGFVVGVSRMWVAVLELQPADLRGLAFVRLEDVRDVVRLPAHQALAETYLKHLGQWPPAMPDLVDLSSTRSLLFTAGSLSRTLSGSCETRRPGFFVGQVVRIGGKRLELRQITPRGQWGKHKHIPLRRLTRVRLWDPYVETITELADSHGS